MAPSAYFSDAVARPGRFLEAEVAQDAQGAGLHRSWDGSVKEDNFL